MKLLLLGGPAWLGATVAAAAHAACDELVCLARGEAGALPAGVSDDEERELLQRFADVDRG